MEHVVPEELEHVAVAAFGPGEVAVQLRAVHHGRQLGQEPGEEEVGTETQRGKEGATKLLIETLTIYFFAIVSVLSRVWTREIMLGSLCISAISKNLTEQNAIDSKNLKYYKSHMHSFLKKLNG